MMLQHLAENHSGEEAIYVSADDIYFAGHNLLEFAEQFYRNGGKRLYIDEIHRYRNKSGDWAQVIKSIYDLIPNLKVVYSGSSILDLKQKGADLSRRKLQYELYGLSFREYLNFTEGFNLAPVSLDDIISKKVEFRTDKQVLPLFKKYLRQGYFPFFDQTDFTSRMLSIITTILELDIPQFLNLTPATITKLKQLLYIISESAPFKPNLSKIARNLALGRNNISDLLDIMGKAGLIYQLRTKVKGISALGKTDKIYLDNTAYIYGLNLTTPEIGNIRETFFIQGTRINHEIYSSKESDFIIDGNTFEVGGKGKGQRQIQGLEKAYIVKDDIEYAQSNILPLWHFGLLY